MTKNFFKTLVADRLDSNILQQLNTIANAHGRVANLAIQQWRRMLDDAGEDPSILRYYAQFIEDVENDVDTANLIQQQAEGLEQVSRNKKRRKRPGLRSGPPATKGRGSFSKRNRIVPVDVERQEGDTAPDSAFDDGDSVEGGTKQTSVIASISQRISRIG